MARRRYGQVDGRRMDVAFALKMGWEFAEFSGGHLKFRHPLTRTPLMLACTPSEHRGLRNKIAWIRRNTPAGETGSACGTSLS